MSGAPLLDLELARERAPALHAAARPLVVFTRDDPRRSTGGVESFTQRLLQAFPGSELVAYAGAAGRRLVLDEARDAFSARSRLASTADQLRPAAIVANGAAAWALHATSVPIVAVFHGTYAGFGRAIAPLAPRRALLARTYGALLERRAGRGRAAVVAVSRRVAEEVRDLYGIRGAIRVIENGTSPVSRAPIERSAARRELGLAGDGCVVLFVGRAEASKGFGEVVALARARPGITLLAAGVAPGGGLPRNLLAQGVVGAAAMARLYAASDLVVLPSRYEGCSLALIDALSSDRPIVATATGCFEQAGEHPFGIIVPLAPGGSLFPRILAAVDAIRADPQRFARFDACRARFAFERFAAEWRALIDEVADRAG